MRETSGPDRGNSFLTIGITINHVIAGTCAQRYELKAA
jgi:hypothetical protein